MKFFVFFAPKLQLFSKFEVKKKIFRDIRVFYFGYWVKSETRKSRKVFVCFKF